MKYQLGLLDDALCGDTNMLISEDGVKELIMNLKKGAFEISTTEGLTLFIQNHHTALKEFEQNPVTEGASSTVLYFLETDFTAYLHDDLTVSNIWQKQFFEANSGFLAHTLASAKAVLGQEIFTIFDKLLNPQSRLTVHQINYLEKFCKAWQEETIDPLKNEACLTLFLYKSNLNSIRFFNHVINCTLRELEVHDSLEARAENVKRYLDEFTRCRDAKPYNPALPSIKIQVTNWLESEHKSLTNKLSKQASLTALSETRLKFQTSLSVAQLVYMFRLFREHGIIINKTEREIYLGISKYFSTPKAENISYDSACNKYYRDDMPVKESIKSLLLKTVRKF